jgi:hypothetical protein
MRVNTDFNLAEPLPFSGIEGYDSRLLFDHSHGGLLRQNITGGEDHCDPEMEGGHDDHLLSSLHDVY